MEAPLRFSCAVKLEMLFRRTPKTCDTWPASGRVGRYDSAPRAAETSSGPAGLKPGSNRPEATATLPATERVGQPSSFEHQSRPLGGDQRCTLGSSRPRAAGRGGAGAGEGGACTARDPGGGGGVTVEGRGGRGGEAPSPPRRHHQMQSS